MYSGGWVGSSVLEWSEKGLKRGGEVGTLEVPACFFLVYTKP